MSRSGSRVGDQLRVYIENEAGYAEQISDDVIVVRAFSDKRIVGVKINGILALVGLLLGKGPFTGPWRSA